MTVCAAVYVAVTVFNMAALGIMGGWGPLNAGTFIGYWFLMLVLFLAMGALAFMFSVMTKSTGATIGIILGVTFLFNMATSVTSLLTLLMMASSAEGGVFWRVLFEISLLLVPGQITFISLATVIDALFGVIELEFQILNGWRIMQSALVGIITLGGAFAWGLAVFLKQDQK